MQLPLSDNNNNGRKDEEIFSAHAFVLIDCEFVRKDMKMLFTHEVLLFGEYDARIYFSTHYSSVGARSGFMWLKRNFIIDTTGELTEIYLFSK